MNISAISRPRLSRPKGIVVAFWIATALFCLQMTFTAYAELRLPQVADAFAHLGFPSYFRVELSWAKLVGVALLLAPMPSRLKEWAYAGFAIDIASAVIAHVAVGDGAEAGGRPRRACFGGFRIGRGTVREPRSGMAHALRLATLASVSALTLGCRGSAQAIPDRSAQPGAASAPQVRRACASSAPRSPTPPSARCADATGRERRESCHLRRHADFPARR